MYNALTIEHYYESEYEDFTLYVKDFEIGSTAYVYREENDTTYRGIIVNMLTYTESSMPSDFDPNDILGTETSYDVSGEFITENFNVYVAIDVEEKACNGRPELLNRKGYC